MRRALIPLTILALVPLPLAAQADTTRSTRLRDVVITAAGTPVELREAPATTTVLDGEQLRERGVATLADALREVAGIAIARSGSFGGTTTLFVRGGERDYTKVLIDGVPVNDPGGDFDFANFSTADIDRIEIVRGPASVLYGSDAVSGVVHVITRRGRTGMTASATARGGSYGTREGELAVQGGRSGATFAITGGRRETDGILPFNNDHRASTVSGSLGYIGSMFGLRLTGRRTDGRFNFPTDGSGVPVDSSQFTDEERDALGLQASMLIGTRTELKLLLSHAGLDRTSANLPDSPGDSTNFYFVNETRSSRRGADLRATFTITPGARLTIGAAYERQRERADGTSTLGTIPLEPTHFDEDRDTRAAYIEMLATPFERLQIAAGARLDDNSEFGNFRTGRFSATLWLTTQTALRGSIGSAFKEPAFGEVFPTAFTVGDTALEPERTRSWELGVDHTIADRLTIGARYFDQRFRDMIQFQFVDRTVDQTTPNFANVAAAEARGVELEGVLALTSGLRLSASATRLHTEVTDEGFGASGTFVVGEPLLRRAEWLGTLGATQRFAGGLYVGASAQYTGERRDFDFGASEFVELDPYTTVDLFANYELPLPSSSFGVTATIRAENVFDEEYQHVFGFEAPGRVLLFGLRASYR